MKENEGKMENALEVRGLTKHYRGFALENVSFSLPAGCIMGFIGENGAGKSTTIRLMLGLARAEAGSVRLLGEDPAQGGAALRERLGVVLDDCGIPETLSLRDMRRILAAGYRTFDAAKFEALAARLSLPERKAVKDYSLGMRMKLSLACALSHDCRLLILDEATSGLDPVVRDELLDIFLEFIQDEGHSIFVSSHILSDLEKVCDYITFIHGGKIVFSEEKDALLEKYVVAKLSEAELRSLEPGKVAGVRRSSFGAEALVERSAARGLVRDPASIEDIMLYFLKGESK